MSKKISRSNRIHTSQLSFNFNSFSNSDCVFYFRFNKNDVIRMLQAMAWPAEQTCTTRNRYAVSPILSTCIVLRRLCTPSRWKELLFGKHGSQLSEIFWESIEHLLETRVELITGNISSQYLQSQAARFAEAIRDKSEGLENCIGFIDGTVIGIARPSGFDSQLVAYNGHKRKHALKFQAVNSPDGMIPHTYGPMEGRRHDWTLYVRSGLDEQLPVLLNVEGKRYCLYGDSGYSRRWFMEVPYQGSALSAEQRVFNKSMSLSRITVEWVFKEVKMYFSTLDYKRKMKVLESPVGSLYIAGMLLCNMRNCIYPNQISRYFKCTPPTL